MIRWGIISGLIDRRDSTITIEDYKELPAEEIKMRVARNDSKFMIENVALIDAYFEDKRTSA
jgi:hypothetical protein